MKKATHVILIILMLLIMPSCRYVCWVMDVAPQNTLFEDCYCCALSHIRSLHIYDQFNTVAHFDALWLSDEIRTSYVQLYADKRQLCPEKYQAILRRQLEENRHFISFYVLAVIPSDQNRILLSDKLSTWSVTLDVNGYIYQPSEVKLVDLPPEYRLMFGKSWTRFKVPYLVKFDAVDINGNSICTRDSNSLTLVFSTICRDSAYMEWILSSDGTVIDECNKPNVLAYDL